MEDAYAALGYRLAGKAVYEAAREETDYDAKTGKPYRVYHAVPVKSGQLNLFVHIDINDATRGQMLKSCVNRREQMVSDGLQLTFDMEHWNRVNRLKTQSPCRWISRST